MDSHVLIPHGVVGSPGECPQQQNPVDTVSLEEEFPAPREHPGPRGHVQFLCSWYRLRRLSVPENAVAFPPYRAVTLPRVTQKALHIWIPAAPRPHTLLSLLSPPTFP